MRSPARMERPLLRGHEVHVEWLRLDAFRPGLPALGEILSTEERQRAARFRFSRDRDAFTITRATLRTILGRYLGLGPREVQLRNGPFGKPALAWETHDTGLRFNVSRSGGLAMLAITRGRRVGVDVEQMRPGFPYREVADRVFTPRERAALDALPADQKAEGFFRGWTCKEAYVKARGTGVSSPLEEFSVSLAVGQPARLLEVSEDPAEAWRWSFEAWTPQTGFAAAVAAEGRDWLLKCRQLIPDPQNPARIQ